MTATLENEVTSEANGEATPKARKAPKTPKAPKAPKAPKEPKAAKPKVDTDEFGCRIGSENEKLNRALSKDTPKSMADLVKEAGLKRGLYGHIRAMMKKGVVVESKDGENRLYALAK